MGPVVVVLITCPGDRSGASDTATTAVQLWAGVAGPAGTVRYKQHCFGNIYRTSYPAGTKVDHGGTCCILSFFMLPMEYEI